MSRSRFLFLPILFALLLSSPQSAAAQALQWHAWSQSIFEQAAREHRFVLLDLEAVWCHWCHVMDETTYRDPAVVQLLQSKYLLVKVDQDSRPDLSNRYEDYGWPATIVFAADGSEIVKRRGYLPPEMMASMLQAIVDDPSPGPSIEPDVNVVYPKEGIVSKRLHAELARDFLDGYDKEHGSWGSDQKYLDWDSVEYALNLAYRGDPVAEHMARETLRAQLHLLDPAWGGVYQYSTDGDWNAPHFEKIMQFQAENLRIYSLAAMLWDEPEYRHTASEIHRYVTTFLMSPKGAFFTSQDADLVEGEHSARYFALNDSERRKRGVPRIDRHIYARENGWFITGLTSFYAATGDRQYLQEGLRAANWIVRNRSLPGGGFRHDLQDSAGPYLGDTVSMGRAFLGLYAVTGNRQWLTRATDCASFIAKNFAAKTGAGYDTAKTPTGRAHTPRPQRDENVMVLRFANLLSYCTGDRQHHKMAETAMRYLAAEPVARRIPASSILLAERELNLPPLHLTVVGGKTDPRALELFLAALRYPGSYKRVEWWDSAEGKLPNHDVNYPRLAHSAAFVCTESTCSPPIFEPEQFRAKVDRLTGVRKHESAANGQSVATAKTSGRL